MKIEYDVVQVDTHAHIKVTTSKGWGRMNRGGESKVAGTLIVPVAELDAFKAVMCAPNPSNAVWIDHNERQR